MPKGPPGQRPPSDMIGAAAEALQAATGDDATDATSPSSPMAAEVIPAVIGEDAADTPRPISTVAAEAIQAAASDDAAGVPSPASAAAQLGKLGGAARARNLTPEKRTEIAKKAAARRWEKK